MRVSSAVRSWRGRSWGTARPEAATCFQYCPGMPPILPKHALTRAARGVLYCGAERACCPASSKGHGATPTLTCVASLTELVRDHTDLDADDVAWLQLLQADW